MSDEGDVLRWDSITYGKHTKATKRNWDRSFARRWSEQRGSAAQYNPYIDRQEIERIEMACARGELGELLERNRRSTVFSYTHNEVIGVSGGEFTCHIIVFRQLEGSVHGFPIRADALEAKKQRARNRVEE